MEYIIESEDGHKVHLKSELRADEFILKLSQFSKIENVIFPNGRMETLEVIKQQPLNPGDKIDLTI